MIKDIFKYLAMKRDVEVPYLILFVTSRCNFRCPNCFNLANLDNGKDDLSLDEIATLAPSLGRLMWLALSGGEPFLREDLPELTALLYRHTRFKRFNIPTNGYATDRILRMVETMLPRIPCDFGVTVSLDGIGADNDALKGVAGSFNAASDTLDGLKSLQRSHRHLSVKVNTVVSRKNMASIRSFGEYVLDRFSPDYHAFELVRAQPVDSPVQPPSVEEARTAYEDIRSVWARYGQYERSQNALTNFLAKGLYRYLHDVHLESMAKETQAIPCLAGKVTAVIYQDGRMALCEMLPAIGNLRHANMDFAALWTSEAADRQRRMIRARGCHCTHTCFQFPSVLFNPAQYGNVLVRAMKSRPHSLRGVV